jgi:hypothetical protein
MRRDCFELLEQALRIGQRELAALRDGRPEEAKEWEEERSRLTQQALEICRDAPLDMLLVEFRKLCDLQKELTHAGEALRRVWQTELIRSRRENRRLAGYGQAAAYALQ